MARKRITVALDADVYRYLDWLAEVSGTHIATRANSLLRMVMQEEMNRPMVAKEFGAWKDAADRSSMFVPLDRPAQ